MKNEYLNEIELRIGCEVICKVINQNRKISVLNQTLA